MAKEIMGAARERETPESRGTEVPTPARKAAKHQGAAQGAGGARQRFVQLSDKASEARDVAALLQWISSARHIVEYVKLAAEVDPSLVDCFRNDGVAFNLCWEPEQENASQRLFHQLQVLCEEMPKLAFPDAADRA